MQYGAAHCPPKARADPYPPPSVVQGAPQQSWHDGLQGMDYQQGLDHQQQGIDHHQGMAMDQHQDPSHQHRLPAPQQYLKSSGHISDTPALAVQ